MTDELRVNSSVRLRTVKAAGVLILAAALATGCSPGNGDGKNAASAQTQTKSVKVTSVSKQAISGAEEQVAEVVSSLALDVMMKTSGDVKEVLKKKGDTVAEGNVLFRLDTKDALLQQEKAQVGLRSAELGATKGQDDYTNGLKELDNAVTQTEQQLSEAIRALNKARNDYDLGSIDKTVLTQAENTVNNLKDSLNLTKNKREALVNSKPIESLKLNVHSSQLTLEEVNRNLEHFEVKATGSGILTEMTAEIGMSMQAGTRAAQIVKTNPIKLKAELTESSASKLTGKQEMSIKLADGTTLKGQIAYLAPVMNPQTKSFSLEVEAPNEDMKLKPGMKAQLIITEEQEQIVPTIQASAVVRENGETFVFVLKDTKAERRKVELGRLNDTLQEVLSGIKEGEQIVISGQHQLKDGETVQLAN